MSAVPADLAFLQWLIDACGYLRPTPLPGGRYAAIAPKAFTHAIVVGQIGDRCVYDDTWCFETLGKAAAALAAWDGTGEPQGWIRHPPSGQRISRDPGERDDDGNPIGAVGVVYRRW